MRALGGVGGQARCRSAALGSGAVKCTARKPWVMSKRHRGQGEAERLWQL